MLDGVRVVDLTTGVAGPYCTKVLADAGADVVKVEPEAGDELRRWRSGALFEFLNAGKRSVHGDWAPLAAAADVVVGGDDLDAGALRREHPALVVVSVSAFGLDGPWAGRPWNEFVLQAACGSTGGRGIPDEVPLAAGGRLGEWVTGTYAALGAVAALREARRSGEGEHVDVAMLDCMAVTMTTYPWVFSSFLGWPPMAGTGRSVEVPSIEPTADGYAVFTTNSAQQFQDFLVMIERSDLLEDRDLPVVAKRFARREEFLAAVHAWTKPRTTAEVLEAAALFRVPAGPVLNGATVEGFEQFARRGVFVPAASGRFRQPRVPYRISGTTPPAAAPSPGNGEHTGSVDWPARPGAGACGDGAGPWRLPLQGVRILDCTAWWAGPVTTHALACLGADVVKVESISRPDGMRFVSVKRPGDGAWWEWGPIFHGANAGKRAVTLDLTRAEGTRAFERLAARADVVVENFTPRVMEHFGLGWERLHELNPELIMVRMPAFGLDGPWRDRTGFAQTMEGMIGMAWVTGFADGPPVLVRGACDPLAGMHSALATILALMERERAGGGRLVESVMSEAALNAAAEQVVEWTASGTLLGRDGNRGPGAAPQGVYRCAGEDRWVALAVADDEQWRALCVVVGAFGDDADLRHEAGRRRRHDELDAVLAAWTAGLDADQVAERLSAAGVPAAAVVSPRDVLHHPQLRARGLFEVERHPVTGDHELAGLPFRYSRVARWNRAPSPVLGQHNDEVLAEAGIDAGERAALREAGVVGEHPVGA